MTLERFGTIAILAPVAIALTLIAARSEPDVFDRFLGDLPPVWVVVGVSVAGIPTLAFLADRGWNTGGGGSLGAWSLAAGAAVVLAGIALTADVVLRFPEDMNITLPAGFAAYPAIAFVVEILLHSLPLALLVAAFGSPDSTSEVRFWVFAAVVALIEAGIQVGFAETLGTAVFSGCHLVAIGVFQVYVFRRFGFVPMLGFRLIYYAFWHITWGAARLHLLF